MFRPAVAMFTGQDAVLPFPLRASLNRVDAQLHEMTYEASGLRVCNVLRSRQKAQANPPTPSIAKVPGSGTASAEAPAGGKGSSKKARCWPFSVPDPTTFPKSSIPLACCSTQPELGARNEFRSTIRPPM